MAVLHGNLADIHICSGTSSATGALTLEANVAHTRYSIAVADKAKRFWDQSFGVTLLVDGDPPAGTYRIIWAGGHVVFDAALAGTEVVTVEGKYYTISQLAEGREWSLDYQIGLVETTAFAAVTKTFEPVLGEGSVGITRWYVDEFFLDQIENKLGLSLYVTESTGSRYDIFARLSKGSIKVPANSLIEESLTFTIDGEISYVAA
jgi:hypothetical protein